ncbi:glycosyltransferase [Ectothiorhodospiraceae bacterium 2226]|nr:glycosyltransferase [Ectothiorhodospiraceae bacterium 2226]
MHIVHVVNKRVPPTGADGGAPQYVAWLAEEQVRQGHTVSIISPSGHSDAGYRYIPSRNLLSGDNLVRLLPSGLDIVHLHFSNESLDAALQRSWAPYVTHVHGNHLGSERPLRNRIYVSKSHAANHGSVHFVYNGVPLGQYSYNSTKDDSLLFLSKVRRRNKGIDAAVRVARHTSYPLVIAGGRRLATPATWLPGYPGVRAVGVVYGALKIRLLQSAKALLFPIHWDEPFGLVLIEAMACGTPVIAFKRGAVEEIVVHGRTGFVCSDELEMREAVEALPTINPHYCREHVEANFSIERTYEGCMAYYRRAQAGEVW